MNENDRKAWVKGARGPTAIGAFVARMLDPIARARGFATTALLTEWPSVVGAELASFTSPDKVIWPRRNDDDRETKERHSAWRTEGAVLVLKVDGPRAIEVQHQAEQILERVNRYFGYRAVAQLRFLQAPLNRPAAAPTAPPTPVADDEALPAGTAIADEGLARALRRLAAGLKAEFTRR